MDHFDTIPCRTLAPFWISNPPLNSRPKIRNLITGIRLEYQTALGHLYRADCLEFLRTVEDQNVVTFFADPPFNLKKDYGSKGSDNIPDADYLEWCKSWLTEGVRVLAPGGALFLYNLPNCYEAKNRSLLRPHAMDLGWLRQVVLDNGKPEPMFCQNESFQTYGLRLKGSSVFQPAFSRFSRKSIFNIGTPFLNVRGLGPFQMRLLSFYVGVWVAPFDAHDSGDDEAFR